MAQKKIAVKSLSEKRLMIDNDFKVSVVRQCQLLGIHRSGLYYKPASESEENLKIMRMLDEQYFKTPFYGRRRIRPWLLRQGILISKNRVNRLMTLMGWQTIYHKKNTSKRNKAHPVYPYLLKGLEITRPNQVWAIDITYVPMRRGFMYLCAIIDVNTRYIVNWGISNTMNTEWVCSIVEEAIAENGQPEILNSDQGSQFTSTEYVNLLQNREVPIKISMDGKGRAIDNIFIERFWKSLKYEDIYIKAYEDGVELYNGLIQYFRFYNSDRGHQSHGYKTPEEMYRAAA